MKIKPNSSGNPIKRDLADQNSLICILIYTLCCHHLEGPFLKEEIDGIVANLPCDKSLGLDGFNGDFLRKCWPLVKHDFYDIC
jgi:hypothetical protein